MIPVLDLFVGLGGLGEGFSAFRDERGNPAFRIALSIEKEPFAHETLKLRSFFRRFPKNDVPEDYYEYLRGKLDRATQDEAQKDWYVQPMAAPHQQVVPANYEHAGFRLRRAGSDSFVIELRGMWHKYSPR